MKIHILILSLIVFKASAQIQFENGYFLTNANRKVECLIKNVDWNDNPKQFSYKLSDGSNVLSIGIDSVKEFGFVNGSKYIRSKVKIERVTNDLKEITAERSSIFKEEILFLKVLVEGRATLYSFEEKNLLVFFFKIQESEIEQLIHKTVLLNQNSRDIVEINTFRSQLSSRLSCDFISEYRFENLKYFKGDLIKLFIKYNECHNSDIQTNKANHKTRDFFNLNLKLGSNLNNLRFVSQSGTFNTNFSNEMGQRIGIEGEYVLPFNKNKWGIFIEPTFQIFHSKKTVEYSSYTSVTTEVDYKAIQVPVGIRHYIFLSKKAKLFINASYVFDIHFNSKINFGYTSAPVVNAREINNFGFLAAGVGLKAFNRLSFETRYQFSSELLLTSFESAKYNCISMIVGYTLATAKQ